jgi:signal transduction histidine kinase
VVVHSEIQKIFEMLRSAADDKKVELVQKYNHNTKTVDAIPNQFTIVLMNIIHNALKYSYSGVYDGQLKVRVDYGEQENMLIIKVHNFGCQIFQDEIAENMLFELGYRGRGSNDRRRKGTGTGLYIANEIVKNHKGMISVSSERSGGSQEIGTDRYHNTFSVYWPYYYDLQ